MAELFTGFVINKAPYGPKPNMTLIIDYKIPSMMLSWMFLTQCQ